MSVPRDGVAVVDAGHKALPIDSGMPLVWGRDRHPLRRRRRTSTAGW